MLIGPLDLPLPAGLDLVLGIATAGLVLLHEGAGNGEDCDDSCNGLNSH